MTIRLVTEILGVIGVGLIVLSYFLLQTGRMSSRDAWFSIANAGGSSLIIVSLISNFNLSAFLIEVFWLIISLYGLLRNSFRGKHRIYKNSNYPVVEELIESKF